MRASWEDVLKYFIFTVSQILGMIEVEIKAMVFGSAEKD